MNGKNFLQRLFGRFRAANSSVPEDPHAGGSAGSSSLRRMLHRTEPVELGCDEVFAMLDEYTERKLGGEEAERLMPLVKQHIDMCADCREEYEALERILQAAASEK